MKVTQEKLPASRLSLEIEISPDMSKQAYEKAIQDLTRSANIPGFRKGKVPRQVLLQRFGNVRIKAMALEDLLEKTIQQALQQEKIAALGNYELRSSFEELLGQFEPGKALTFAAAVDVQPEATLTQYQGFTIQAEEVKPDPNRVDELLEQRRKSSATLVPVEDRPAQMGDVAIVDFAGRKADTEEAPGEPISGAQAKDFQIEMEEGRFIAGFVDGIVGMNPGDNHEFTVTFPEDYPEESIAGQPAIFNVTLKELKTRDLPELDDDLAKEISEFETLAELRASLEERFQKEADRKTATNKEQAILKELVQYLEVDLPESLIEQEVTYMLTQTAMQLQNQGLDYQQLLNRDTIPDLRQRLRPEAIERIKRTLALGEVAKKESLTADEAAVQARINEIKQDYKEGEIDLARLQEVVHEELLKEKIIGWLEENSTLELVPEGTLKQSEPEPAPAEPEIEASEAT
ncbi:MAG: trigger factor, partial [Leptolyngbyaceae cyanobacterium bins.59]|nr:trigger factor [Leptolyngbyaceae cyanobacterium bins.59]